MRGSWCGHNPQSGGSFRWERRGSGIRGGRHIGRHGGEIWTHRETRRGNFEAETQISGNFTHKSTEAGTEGVIHKRKMDKGSMAICKNVQKQNIILSLTNADI